GLRRQNTEHVLPHELRRRIDNGERPVSAGFVTPYPPGFPVLVPGQIITAEVLDFMSALDTRELHGYDSRLGHRVDQVDDGAERREWFIEHSDDLRTFLMCEPRGHGWLSGAILQPPTRSDADWGVLFIEVTGVLPMCGAGTIAVATVLVETGMVAVTSPVTTV